MFATRFTNMSIVFMVLGAGCFAPPARAKSGPVPLSRITIDGTQSFMSSTFVVDLDADTDLDIVGTSFLNNLVFWWENVNGDGKTWVRHAIDANITGPSKLAAGDLDGDTDLDVVGISLTNDQVLWWEQPAEIGDEWIRHEIDPEFLDALPVLAVNVDGDADVDVIAGALSGNLISWWENTAGDATEWTEHVIAPAYPEPFAMAWGDLDDDTFSDLVVVSPGAARVTWFSNVSGNGATWIEHDIDTTFNGVRDLVIADLNGDLAPDVVAVARTDDDVAWYENVNGDGLTWTRRSISGFFNSPSAIGAADFDNDGDFDVMAAAQFSDEINWYENLTGDALSWQKHTISFMDSPTHGNIGDVDNDGDVDILGGSTFTSDTFLWLNRETCPADTDCSGDVGIDDFLAVLAAWGPCPLDCETDIVVSGTTGIDDFLAVLAQWGACP